MARNLIVNADDFGLTPGINAGIAKCHEQGILTSASLMVRGPAAAEAAAYAQAHPLLSVGLHIDLCEWEYRDEDWRCVYQVVSTDDPLAVSAEVQRQLAAFRALRGRQPTHLDSHQHVHRAAPVRSIVEQVARELGIPLRDSDPRVRYCGAFYGQSNKGYPYPEGIFVAALEAVIAGLPEGLTELACHPAATPDVVSVYRAERVIECDTLCDPRIRDAVAAAGIRLCSFADVI